MKKLMIAAAIVCAAAMSQAAAYDWTITTATGGELANFEGTANFTGAAYIFNGDVGEAAWTALIESDGSLDDFAAANGGQAISFANGIASGTFGTDDDLRDASFVTIVSDGNGHIFIDDPADASWDYTQGQGIAQLDQAWTAEGAFSYDRETSLAGFEGGAWYTAAAVPEPTSGLLLLLGVAGLALRRRRA